MTEFWVKIFVHLGINSGAVRLRRALLLWSLDVLDMVCSGLPMLFLGNVILCWSIIPESALLDGLLTTLYRFVMYYCELCFIYKAERETVSRRYP